MPNAWAVWQSEERKRLLTLIVRANAVAEDLSVETTTSKHRPTLTRYYKERDEFVEWLIAQERNSL